MCIAEAPMVRQSPHFAHQMLCTGPDEKPAGFATSKRLVPIQRTIQEQLGEWQVRQQDRRRLFQEAN